jgi:SAM-dependent MidA family methyltransferase
MSRKMPSPLLPILLERIHRHGPLTVAEFVETALYHPSLGYYSSDEQRSGRRGDFVTSVDAGPVFGQLLAVQFAEMWGRIRVGGARHAESFDLVEAAAGNGRLARDILDQAADKNPDVCEAVRLHLVERSPRAREAQADVLGCHAARLVRSSPDLPEDIEGVIYANELLDALPPHLVVMRHDGLHEIYVDARPDGRLVRVDGPLSSTRIVEYLRAVGARLEPGWIAEVNLAAADWVRMAASRLARGFLVLIDYGAEAAFLYSAGRARGTLTSYRRHAAEGPGDGPGWLTEPGQRDITSHVDFTGVALAGRQAGLTVSGLVDQTYFLLALGIAGGVLEGDVESKEDRGRLRALKTLTMPGGMGSTHKVIVFSKGVDDRGLLGLSQGGRITQ